MSGDFGPRITIPAAQKFAHRSPDSHLTLFGDAEAIKRAAGRTVLADNISIHPCRDVIAMDAEPRHTLRHGRESSMWQALQALADGRTQACVSAGNSGALMLISRRVLGVIPGVEVPAFSKSMPVESGYTLMLDLGGNLHCSAQQLLQFARMGQIQARASGYDNPRIALLNIGSEAGKGTRLIREAAELLEAAPELNFQGSVEADSIFTGSVEVIVCDGFSGNIALKTSEGVARVLGRRIQHSFSSFSGRVAGVLIWPILRRWRQEFNPDAYNGAVLAGLNGVVVKSHGGAGVEATINALELAAQQARRDVPGTIANAVAAQ
ncbi:phosphate acyltransferase PlsX [Gilvimarinus sp. HB14]|uniref:Phosphate acyltransferase n=2 Tax=Gilvimarinus xylanilyticus TaxID=2944139 RepID=A0A9X2KSS8_9GAMM|nr:phosphate acyltransferase PlsX [Gilvimarinus xylanilyticus]